MGGKSQTQTNTSSQSYTPTGLSGLQDIWSRLQNVASQPYTPYNGQLTAGLTNTQQAGIGNVNSAYGTAQPYIDQATNYANQAAGPISAGQIQNYLNPYNQSVIDATQAQFNNQNAQQANALKGNSIARGAFGGNREAVAQAQLAGQQQLAQAPVIANLNSQNYNQALNAAQQDRAAQGQAAYALGNLGTTSQNAALQGAQAQLGAGTLEQQTNQNALNAQYQQYLQAQAFPYQQAQFLASLGVPTLGAQGGITSGSQTQTTPGPSPWGQALGFGTAALGLFSDERVKENAEKVGKTFDGQNIYRFNYKGDPTTHMGLMAQEVEERKPEAVGSVGGIKTVNYKTATEDAAHDGYASGGSVSPFDMREVVTYVPKVGGIQSSPVQAPSLPQSQMQSGGGGGGLNLPSGDALKGAWSGIQNIFSSPMSLGGNYDANMIGPAATGSTGMVVGGLKDGGRVDFMDTVHAIRSGLKGNKHADGGRVFASPDDLAMMRQDVPLTQDRAHQIYDAYERAGGGQDVSNSPFVKNSLYGIMPWRDLNIPISEESSPFHFLSGLFGKKNYADGGIIPFASRWADIDSAKDVMTRPAAQASPIPVLSADNLGLGKPVDWSPAQEKAPSLVAAGATPETMDVMAGVPTGNLVGAPGNALAFNAPNGRVAANPLAIPDIDELPPNAKPTQYIAPTDGKKSGLGGWNPFNMSDDARLGLAAAGLGMMASRSPFALTQIGEGGLQGLKNYQELKSSGADRAMKQQQIDLQAQNMARQAQQFSQEFGLKQKTFNENVRQHDVANMKPIKIGTDITGQDIFGVADPSGSGYKIIDPETGKLRERTADDVTNINPSSNSVPVAPVEIRAQAPAGSNEARNSAFLAQIAAKNPGLAEQIKAVVDYKLDPNKTFSMRNNVRDKVMRMVYQYDPTYDATTFPARNKSVSEFATGKLGNQVRSFDVSIAHLGSLEGLADDMQNGGIPAFNKLKNYVKTALGAPEPISFDAAKKIVADEVAKGIIGGQTAVADREEYASKLLNSNSPEQFAGVLRAYKELLGGQLRGLKKQYEDTTKLHNFDSRLDPKTIEAINAAERKNSASSGGSSSVEPSPSQPTFTGRTASGPKNTAIPPAAARETGKVYTTPKGDYRWNGSGWEKP